MTFMIGLAVGVLVSSLLGWWLIWLGLIETEKAGLEPYQNKTITRSGPELDDWITSVLDAIEDEAMTLEGLKRVIRGSDHWHERLKATRKARVKQQRQHRLDVKLQAIEDKYR